MCTSHRILYLKVKVHKMSGKRSLCGSSLDFSIVKEASVNARHRSQDAGTRFTYNAAQIRKVKDRKLRGNVVAGRCPVLSALIRERSNFVLAIQPRCRASNLYNM
jgi:hypothetical protein